MEAEWPKYASVNYDIIGWDNGMSPVIWTDVLLMELLGRNLRKILVKS